MSTSPVIWVLFEGYKNHHKVESVDVNDDVLSLVKIVIKDLEKMVLPVNVNVYYQGSDVMSKTTVETLAGHWQMLSELIKPGQQAAFFRMEIKLATSSPGHLEIDHGTIEYPSRNKLLSPSLYSASKGISSQIAGDDFVFQPKPVLLKVRSDVLDASSRLYSHFQRLGNNPYQLFIESNFYSDATNILPQFANISQLDQGFLASDLFGSAVEFTNRFDCPLTCKPELPVRSVGGEGIYRCCYNGEIKSLSSTSSFDQAVIYTFMDMVRVFFPKSGKDAIKPGFSRFFHSPPTGFALVGFPHVGYILSLEWIGRIHISVASTPFILGSKAHVDAVAALHDESYESPLEFDQKTGAIWNTVVKDSPLYKKVSWRMDENHFRKILRFDCYKPDVVVHMARVYSRLEQLKNDPSITDVPDAVVLDSKLYYGEHEVMVEMEAVVGKECEDDDIEKEPSIREAICAAVAWLAMHGILYTDLRGPNVLRTPDGRVRLVDYDDCLFEESKVSSFDEYERIMKERIQEGRRGKGPVVAQGTVINFEGKRPVFMSTLRAAFSGFQESKSRKRKR